MSGADVFISYKRSDRARIAPIADYLRAAGLQVWLDARLEAGETFDVEITRNLRAAKVVLVCWSKDSVESQWVRAEATEGREAGTLVAVMLEACRPYPPFNLIHMEDLSTWRGQDDHAAFSRVMGTIARKAGRADLVPTPESPKRKPAGMAWAPLAIAGLALVGATGAGFAASYFLRRPPPAVASIAPSATPPPVVAPVVEAAAPSVQATVASAPPSAAPGVVADAVRIPRGVPIGQSFGSYTWAEGSSELDARNVQSIRSQMKNYPGLENIVAILIHRATKYEDGQALMERRVAAIRQAYIDAGVPAAKVRAAAPWSRDPTSIRNEIISIGTCENTKGGDAYSTKIMRESHTPQVTGCVD